MCARYYIAEDGDPQELRQITEAVKQRIYGGSPAEIKTSGEIFPTDTVPAVANNRKMVPTAFAMKWGFSASGRGPVINARSETASVVPMFRDGMAQRRCVIPANRYFEWEKRGREKIKYAIGPDRAGIMYMAGLYRLEYGRPVFTILTRPPADSIAFIHDRMPVILPKELINDWLNPKYIAEEMLKSAELDVSYARA